MREGPSWGVQQRQEVHRRSTGRLCCLQHHPRVPRDSAFPLGASTPPPAPAPSEATERAASCSSRGAFSPQRPPGLPTVYHPHTGSKVSRSGNPYSPRSFSSVQNGSRCRCLQDLTGGGFTFLVYQGGL